MRMWCVVLMLGVLPAGYAAGDSRCTYRGVFYGPDSMSCQAGVQAQCVGGSWKPTGSRCAGEAADPSGEETQPGVVEPRVNKPGVVEPGAGSVPSPRVPQVGGGGSGW